MNNKVAKALAFVAGAVIGSAITWKFVKTKYERIAQEEIDSVKEVFSKRNIENSMDEEVSTGSGGVVPEGMTVGEYLKIIADQEYTNNNERKEKLNNMGFKKPYVIKPEEYGEADGYDMISLNYYADGVLTDDWDVPIENIEFMVGEDFADHFGEYEEDSVFIRNDSLKAEFEILADVRNYSDIRKDPPDDEE